jgi:nucleoside-diphosphate-sugar epimerase
VTSACDARVTIETRCQPETAYGRSKLAGERALLERAHDTKMTWTILRPTLVYGPGNPGNMERLVSLVQRGVPLPLGAIGNRRSLTFVENLVSATLTALVHPGANNATFLVADGQDVSTPDLVRRIAALAGTRTRVVSVPLPLLRGLAAAADTLGALSKASLPFGTATLQRLESSLYVDVEPLRVTLGWTPPFSLDEGLRCMLTRS